MESIHIYFDESIHDRGGFVLGAFVCGRDVGSRVSDALTQCGLRPGTDEFKSSARMDREAKQVKLREHLKELLRDYRIGVVVAPTGRDTFGLAAMEGISKIIRLNRLERFDLSAFFDQGVFSSSEAGKELARQHGVEQLCKVAVEQDSRVVGGLQLADLVAHTCATMLLERLGLVRKTVRAGDNSRYDPDMPIELGFELWATLRYQFLKGGLPRTVESNADMVVDVDGYCLHIAEGCTTEVRAAAAERFGKCYLGCIH